MLNQLVVDLVMKVLHRLYVKQGSDILTIKGTGKKYPRYMLYSEKPNVYKRMDEF